MASLAKAASLITIVIATTLTGCDADKGAKSARPAPTGAPALEARHFYVVAIHPEIRERVGQVEDIALRMAFTSPFLRAGLLGDQAPKEDCVPDGPRPGDCHDGYEIRVSPAGEGYRLSVTGSVAGVPLDRRIERTPKNLNVDGLAEMRNLQGGGRSDGPTQDVVLWSTFYSASILNDLAEIGQAVCSETRDLECPLPQRLPWNSAPPAT